MSIIDTIALVNEVAENELDYYEPGEDSDPEYVENADKAINAVKAWLVEYQNLAPNWDSDHIPAWVKYLTVDASGGTFGYGTRPQVSASIWYPIDDTNDVVYIGETQIPIGIDWRLLCWERPETHAP